MCVCAIPNKIFYLTLNNIELKIERKKKKSKNGTHVYMKLKQNKIINGIYEKNSHNAMYTRFRTTENVCLFK